MKYIDEYREPDAAAGYAHALARITTRPWTIMEVCGGQTHSIVKFGVDELLPKGVTLVHGPGCPVCVTPLELIEKAIEIASRPGVIFCSFGDMLRVPGRSEGSAVGQGRGRQTCASSTRRSTRSPSRAGIPTARSSSSPWASRPRRRPTRWPSTRRTRRASRTSRCSFRTCSCRRPWRRFSRRPSTASRAFSPPATCAR